MALTASFELTGSSVMTNPLDLSTPSDSPQIGTGEFPEASIDFEDGTGSLQAQAHWHDLRTVAAGATDSIDLYGSLTGPFGATVNAVKVKAIVVVIDSPASTKVLRVGPQNVSNAAQLGFGGVGSTVYIECDSFLPLISGYAGWSITAGTGDLLPIKNPGSVDITYAILVLFTTS